MKVSHSKTKLWKQQQLPILKYVYFYSNSFDYIFYFNLLYLFYSLLHMSLWTAALPVNFSQGGSINEHLILSHLHHGKGAANLHSTGGALMNTVQSAARGPQRRRRRVNEEPRMEIKFTVVFTHVYTTRSSDSDRSNCQKNLIRVAQMSLNENIDIWWHWINNSITTRSELRYCIHPSINLPIYYGRQCRELWQVAPWAGWQTHN